MPPSRAAQSDRSRCNEHPRTRLHIVQSEAACSECGLRRIPYDQRVHKGRQRSKAVRVLARIQELQTPGVKHNTPMAAATGLKPTHEFELVPTPAESQNFKTGDEALAQLYNTIVSLSSISHSNAQRTHSLASDPIGLSGQYSRYVYTPRNTD
ncbi:hypothetical protein FA13DRAFT_1731155 [Coprinellus micaceus]|uniref:Uncharacterized protein n=1 Tax=Coprinellus micaceus TaxID=71717 RepID=A0A4Y7TEU2_COPMI|nr:hypothetical protein FA13DRAFT_1731155 [Coprinellus micaceus]